MEPLTTSGAQPQKPFRRGRLDWLPIPLLLVAIIAARMAGLREIYESHILLLVLSFTFYTMVSLGTLYLVGRSFLASGAPGLLFLECGVILWSLAGTIGDIVSHGDANINVTIFNISIMLAGMCHLTGTVLTVRPQRVLRMKLVWLCAGCAFILGALWLVSQAALSGWLPIFFIPGHGGTLVRYCVLISAIFMFVLSAGMLFAYQRERHLPFTSWYALALLLMAVGLFGVMIQFSLGSVVNWLSRSAQWLSGVYLLIAALASLRESDLPLLPLANKSNPAYYRGAVAVAIVLAATAIRLAFLSAIGTNAPYLLFFPAVMFVAIYGGLRSGILATALSAIVADYFWIEPAGTFTIAQPADWLTMVVFLLSGAMISWVADSMLRARASATAAEMQLQLVAERKLAEEAVSRSQKALSELIERSPFGTYVVDAQFRIAQMNTVSQNEAFRNVRPVIGRDFAEAMRILWPEPVANEITGHFRHTLDSGESYYSRDFLNLRHDVEIVEAYEWELHRITLQDGQYGVVCYYYDSTKLREAELSLRKKEVDLSEAQRQAHIGSWHWDAQTDVTTGSEELLRLYGFDPATQRMPDFKEQRGRCYPVEDWERINAAVQRTMETGEGYELDVQVLRDGSIRWATTRGGAEWDAQGRIIGLRGTVQDITERKQAEDALRRSEEQYRTLFSTMLEGFCIIEMLFDENDRPIDYRFLEVNPAFEAQTGLQGAQGKRMRELAPHHEAHWFEIYGHVALTGESVSFVNEAKALNRWFDVSAYRVEDRKVGIFFNDITERMRAEAELRGAHDALDKRVKERTKELAETVDVLRSEIAEREQAERALREETLERLRTMEELRKKEQILIHQSRQAAMGEMIGNIAHQWRQPLNVLGMQIQKLQLLYDLGEFNKELLDQHVSGSMEIIQHMSKTIDDFRNYFIPEKKKVEFKVHESVSKALMLLEGSLKNPPIDVEVIARDDHVFYGYPNEFTQVLLNIINNARDVIIERNVSEPKVIIRIFNEDSRTVVTVTDNAGGIPEDIINQIFDPYFTTKGPQHGTGIGLFMSKSIIEKSMGGRLGVRNTADGAEFRIEVGNENPT